MVEHCETKAHSPHVKSRFHHSILCQLTIPIGALGQVFEPIIVQGSQKARIPLVPKVQGTQLLFKSRWLMDFKGSPVRHPRNETRTVGIRAAAGQHMMDFFTKRHGRQVSGNLIVGWCGYLGKIPIVMIGHSTASWKGRNRDGLGRKIVAGVVVSLVRVVGSGRHGQE